MCIRDSPGSHHQNDIPVTKMTLDHNGKLGIGTDSPAKLLHLHQANSNALFEAVNIRTNSSGEGLALGVNADNSSYVVSSASSDSLHLGGSSSTINGTGHITIKGTGYVGVGQGTPVTKLDVNGAIRVATTLPAPLASGVSGMVLDYGSSYGRFWSRGTNSTTAGGFKFICQEDDGGGEITPLLINGTGAIQFNSAFTFPTTDGSANQVLKTDGSGTLSWTNQSGGGGGGGDSIYTQIFASSSGGNIAGDYFDSVWGSGDYSYKHTESDTSRTAGVLYRWDEGTSTSSIGPYSIFGYNITRKFTNYTAPTKVKITEVFAAGAGYIRSQQNLVMMFLICNEADAWRPRATTTSEAQARIPVGWAVFCGGNADSATKNAWSRGCKTGSTFSGTGGSATNTMGSATGVGLWSIPSTDYFAPSRSHQIHRFGLTDSSAGAGTLTARSATHPNAYRHPSWNSSDSVYHEPDGQFYFKADASTWSNPKYHVGTQVATGNATANAKDYLHRSGDLILEKGDSIFVGFQHHHDGTESSSSNDWLFHQLSVHIKTEEV